MSLLISLRSFVSTLFQRSRIGAEMDEELRSHIEHRADDLERSGLSRSELAMPHVPPNGSREIVVPVHALPEPGRPASTYPAESTPQSAGRYVRKVVKVELVCTNRAPKHV